MKKLNVLMILAIFGLAVFVNSCQKEITLDEPVLKSVVSDTEGSIVVSYPDKVYAEHDFAITFSACDDAVLLRGAPGNDCESETDWTEVASYSCDGDPVTVTENIAEIGNYVYKIVVTPFADGETDECNDCEVDAEDLEQCLEIMVCREETAFGGDDYGTGGKNGKGAWFYYYEPEPIVVEEVIVGYEPETVYADENLPIGIVELNPEGTLLTITLDCGWELRELTNDGTAPCMEQVKVKEYSSMPAKRPSGNQFDYKGSSLEVEVEFDGGETEGYIIHLDVEYCSCEQPE